MAQDGHRQRSECSGERTDPDFAALVRQGHLLWHERHFPFSTGVVKFWPGRSQTRNFQSNSIYLA
jgi:hypothetical protein